MTLTPRQLRSKALRALREKEKGAAHYEKYDQLIGELIEAVGPGTFINLGKFGTVLLLDKAINGEAKLGQFCYFRRYELKYTAKASAVSA